MSVCAASVPGPSEESFGNISRIYLAANFARSSFVDEPKGAVPIDLIGVELSKNRRFVYFHPSCFFV